MKKNKLGLALELFCTFFKIGLFTFGGGYAMITLIQSEASAKKKWITDEDILEIAAIAESTPGPIAVNSATFVGYKTAGVLGAFFATLGVVVPSFVIICIISRVFEAFGHIRAVKYAFFGIKAGVLALMLKALFSMYEACPKSTAGYITALAAFAAVSIFNINVLLVIILCAISGIIRRSL